MTKRSLLYLWLALAGSGSLSLGHSLAIGVAFGADEGSSQPLAPQIAEASSEGEEAITGFKLSEGWQIGLFAAEPDVANIVAFDIDNKGRFFVCESFRQNKGVTDNRGHDETWLRADLAAQTVQDRIDYHKRLLGDEAKTYTEQDDRIRLLVDTDNDGRADEVSVYAEGFHQLEDGTAAGVLARGKNVYLTCIPKLYNLIDNDGDGRADDRIVMSDGYGVRVAFRGHDMHGLIIGPDGRLYFSIGDRGYHVMTTEGELLHNPAVGAVFRCELDGSRLEVFANGLRNPQELAFNDYGDLFTGDNNSDSGDQARLVNVLQDGDTGWRMFYQYLPDRGPFNREKIWQPFHDDQPAYLVPPIANFADGPSGFAFYPGTGFGNELKDKFLLADFRGTASNSGIRTIQLEESGAFFKIKEDGQAVWSILATDLAFGPDGALYISDWVNGWDGEGKGRIYRVTNPKYSDSQEVREVASLLGSDWSTIDLDTLSGLIAHRDRRVRNEAQWELASRGASDILIELASDTQLSDVPRLHALWGLEQIVRRANEIQPHDWTKIRELLHSLLVDTQPHVRAAAAKFAGEHSKVDAGSVLITMLSDSSPRVRYFAARAIGWSKQANAIESLVLMLAENDNRDPVLRHGGIMALSSVATANDLVALKDHPSANVRRAAVVALRRQGSAQVSQYLADGDGRVVAEAVRAIHDASLQDAWTDLAEMIDRPLQDENVVRRVLNANFRLGRLADANALARFAAQDSASEAMRLEAISMLGDWENPDQRDRVLNEWRPLESRSMEGIATSLQENLPGILAGPEAVRNAAIELAADLGLKEISPLLAQRLDDVALEPASRGAALRAMTKLDPLEAVARAKNLLAITETASEIRVAAIETLATLAAEESVGTLIASAEHSTDSAERQAAWDALATIDSDDAKRAVTTAVEAVIAGSSPLDAVLNIVEAADRQGLHEVTDKLNAQWAKSAETDPLALWQSTLEGGNEKRGEVLFFTKTELSCVRCHKVGDQGGEVGPNLGAIAKDKERRYLLEAIVLPDAQIAKGFETTILADDLGNTHIGIVRSETDEFVELIKADGSQVRVLTDEIVARRRGQSAMPADLTKFMTRRELRDLVAYLATLKELPTTSDQPEGH